MSENQQNNEIITRVSQNTENYFKEIWKRNARVNLHIYKKVGKIQHMEMPGGKFPFICGTAPSLQEHFDLIKQYREHLLLICADTAFSVLYKNEIYPDFVINVDAAESIKACFAFKDQTKLLETALVAATISSPEALAEWRGKIYLYNLYDPNIETLRNVSLMYPHLGRIDSKFNVGEFMIFFAVRILGFKQMAFTGLDFAYPNMNMYADGSLACGDIDGDKVISLMDCDNSPVYTSRIFQLYMFAFMRNYMEYYSKAAKIYSLNKGILPLKYEKDEFIKCMEDFIEQKAKYNQGKVDAGTN